MFWMVWCLDDAAQRVLDLLLPFVDAAVGNPHPPSTMTITDKKKLSAMAV